MVTASSTCEHQCERSTGVTERLDGCLAMYLIPHGAG